MISRVTHGIIVIEMQETLTSCEFYDANIFMTIYGHMLGLHKIS
jgi:hypothetical protein